MVDLIGIALLPTLRPENQAQWRFFLQLLLMFFQPAEVKLYLSLVSDFEFT